MSSTTAVYKLQSDTQFIRIWKGLPDINVYEYKGDPNAFGVIYADDRRWVSLAVVGHSATSQFKALEIMGVKIEGAQLKQLAEDLTFVDSNGLSFYLMVNRQGLCLLLLLTQSVTWMRCNDRFGWSKYGVKPQNSGRIWSICDMSNGDVLVDRKDGDGNEYLERLLEKDKSISVVQCLEFGIG